MKKPNYFHRHFLKGLSIVGVLSVSQAYGQVGVGTPTPNASAQLDVVANDKGILIPRLALTGSTDATTIANGNVTSLLVFNTATVADVVPGFYYWDGAKWDRFATGTSSVSSGTGAPTGFSPLNPSAGDIYVDETTGDIYTYDGTTWIDNSTVSSGATPPAPGSPANAMAGDIYVNNVTGDVYTYNGTTWENQSGVSADANNILINGTDGLAYLDQAIVEAAVGLSSGTGNPSGTPGNAGDVYIDETTGDVWTYNGTEWVAQPDGLSTGVGAPNPGPANPSAGDIYVDETSGDVYTYNGTTWVNQTVGTITTLVQTNGSYTYTSEDGTTTTFNVSQTGAGDPSTNGTVGTAGDIYVDETTGDIYTYDGTTWIDNSTVSSGATPPAPGSPANAMAGDIYVNNVTGDVYTYNGTTWENQSGVSADANNILINGTDGLAYLDQAIVEAAVGLSSGVGNPTGTPGNAGDVYIDETTGDVWTYNGTEWVAQPDGLSTGTGAPIPGSPLNPSAGDIYVDATTGDVYTYNGTTWAAAETVTTLVDNGDGTMTYTNEAGVATIIDLAAIIDANETLTTLVDNGDGTMTYTDENGVATIINSTVLSTNTFITDGTIDVTGDGIADNGVTLQDVIAALPSIIDANETLTTLVDNGDGTMTYTDEDGVATIIDLAAIIDANETLTTLVDNGDGTMTYTDENGVATIINSTVLSTNTFITDGTIDVTGDGNPDNGVTLQDVIAALPSIITANETLTSATFNATTGVLTYNDEAGTANAINIAAMIPNFETLTSISQDAAAGTITYVDEDGVSTVLDLGALIAANETVTTLVDNTDGTYTYTSEDGTATSFSATPEPWKNAATGTAATANTQNIYQMGNVGVGMNNPTSQLQTAGPISTPVASSASNITLNNTHSVVRVDATSGDKTVTLPAAASAVGRVYTVVKTDGTANKIIFSSTIIGSDFTFTQANVPGSYQIQSDGTDWVLIK